MNLEILFSYKITNILAQVASFFRFCSSFNSARYLENERYKANTKIVLNISKNAAPFVSITQH